MSPRQGRAARVGGTPSSHGPAWWLWQTETLPRSIGRNNVGQALFTLGDPPCVCRGGCRRISLRDGMVRGTRFHPDPLWRHFERPRGARKPRLGGKVEGRSIVSRGAECHCAAGPTGSRLRKTSSRREAGGDAVASPRRARSAHASRPADNSGPPSRSAAPPAARSGKAAGAKTGWAFQSRTHHAVRPRLLVLHSRRSRGRSDGHTTNDHNGRRRRRHSGSWEHRSRRSPAESATELARAQPARAGTQLDGRGPSA